MSAEHVVALVTLAAVLLLAGLMGNVGRARGRYGVKAPATSGPPEFERAFRAHANTLEAMVMFLPSLWLAAHYGSAWWAAVIGAAWVVGRIWYGIAYASGGNRGPGFTIGTAANAILIGIALVGVMRAATA